MKLNTSVTLSSAELTSETIKNSTKNILSSSVSQFKHQSENMAEQDTTDRDTSKVLYKTKTATAPVTTAFSKAFIDNEYKKAVVKFASEYESQSAYFVNELEKDHIFLRKEFSKESPVVAEDWGSLKKTIDLRKVDGSEYFKYGNYMKKGNYQISNKKMTVYDKSEINDIIRTTGLKLKRLEKRGVNGKIPVNQTEVYKKFEKMHSDALKIQKLDKKSKQKSPKRLKRQLIRLALSPVSSSEAMQGYRLMEHCTMPVLAGCRFASKQANRIGYTIAKKAIAKQYIKAQPEIASHVLREDAKRYALERLRKTSSTTFFKDVATKKALNHLEKATAHSTSHLGKSVYNTVRMQKSLMNDAPKNAIKIATKESVKSALNATTYGRKALQTQKKTKQTISAAKKIATKPARFVAKKFSNTFAYRVFERTNIAIKGAKRAVKEMAKALLRFLLSALTGFFTSVISTLASFITVLLPIGFLLPFIAIILSLGMITSSVDGNGTASRYVTDENWASVCATVKQAVAETRAGYGDNAYSQSTYYPITINGIEYTTRPDCSGYVSLCLQIYGSLQKGDIWNSALFTDSPATAIPGFTKCNLKDIGGVEGLQCGDIMTKHGHVFIFDRCENGTYYIWSNGSDKTVMSPVSTPASVSYLLDHPTVWRCTGELSNQNNTLPVTPPQDTAPSPKDTIPTSLNNNNPTNVLPVVP